MGATATVETSAFGIIGWAPEGQVFFRYDVGVNGTGTAYIASAGANIDGDAAEQAWGYVHPAPGAATAAGVTATLGTFPCVAAGLPPRIEGGVSVVNTVGPCLATYGQSVF